MPVPPIVSAPVSPAPASKKEKENMTMFSFGLLGVLVLVVLVAAGFGIFRVYAKASSDNFTYWTAKILRLPLAKVNGQTVRYSAYLNDLRAIKILRDYEKNNGGTGQTASLTDSQLSDQVLWRLVSNIIIADIARELGVKAEASEIAEAKSSLLAQFADEAEAEKELLDRYGWTLSDYEEKVIGPFVLQQKLVQKIQTDQTMRDKARQRAEEALKEFNAGADFQELAKKYSEDNTAAKGGDLGCFPKDVMVPQFETAAFALKKGETTKELVETQYGYHLIQVYDRKTETPAGSKTPEEQVCARHIITLFPSLDKVFDEKLKTAGIHLYPKMNNPFVAQENTAATAAE